MNKYIKKQKLLTDQNLNNAMYVNNYNVLSKIR